MSEERVFAEPWEAQAFALVVALNERGVFTWAEWTEAVASAPEEGYYERWLATLERLLLERGETDEFITARQASNARKREKLAAYAREDRKKARERGEEDPSPDLRPVPTVAFKDQYHLSPVVDIPTINPPSIPTTPTRMSRTTRALRTPSTQDEPST